MRALRRLAGPGADEVIVPGLHLLLGAGVDRQGGPAAAPGRRRSGHARLRSRGARRRRHEPRAGDRRHQSLRHPQRPAGTWWRFGRARGVFVVDDAAQALGATSSGRPAGTWGDAGLYSLDKGKNVSAIDGGVLVTGDDRVAEALRAEIATLGRPDARAAGPNTSSRRSSTPRCCSRGSTGCRTRSRSSGSAGRSTPPSSRSSSRIAALAALGGVMLRELAAFTAARARATPSRSSPPSDRRAACRSPAAPADCQPGVAAAAAARRRCPAGATRSSPTLTAAGIGATTSYPASLADVPELRPSLAGDGAACPGARTVASRILTLPTHPYVSARGHRAPSPTSCASVVDADPVPAAMGAATR